MASRPYILYMLISALMLMGYTMADSAEEKQKCAEQLTGMATCLPYLGGDAKAPTPDCCSGLKQAMKNNKRCICLIIKDRDDPDLGLKISLTLSLGLPSLCNLPDNFSQCPAILHLDPKSAEAQSFNQLGQNSNNAGSNSPTPSPAGKDNTPSGKGDAGATATSNPAKSEACYEGKRLFKSSVAWLLIWFSM